MAAKNHAPDHEDEPSIEQLEQEFGITIHRPSPLPPLESKPNTPAPFIPPSKSTDGWFYAGPISSFPNLDSQASETYLGSPASPSDPLPCKVFSQVPTSTSITNSSLSSSAPCLPQIDMDDAELSAQGLLIFQYRGKVHAIEHACPHQGYPMSKATVSDIEDFGVVLSAGIMCPKHGWTFDLFTGEADTGRYKLGVWEVDVRAPGAGEENGVWVRKKVKRRIG